MTPLQAPITTCAPVVAGTNGEGSCRALFLDRDGIINVDHGYVHTPEATSWVPGIFDLARAARTAGYVIVIVTNQAGIARGYYDVATFEAYTRWMHSVFEREGVNILATYYCPHHPDAGLGEWKVQCECRKPKPGMLLAAAERFNLDVSRSTMLGDQIKDAEAGKAAGIGCCVVASVSGVIEELASRLFS